MAFRLNIFYMSKGRFEDTEVLIRHSDLILTYLERLNNEFRDDGKLMGKLKGSNGQQLLKYTVEFAAAVKKGSALPPASSSIQDLREGIAKDLCNGQLIQLIGYACYWIKLAKFQLQIVNQNTREYDLTWNYLITIRISKLFVAFCKICIYLSKIPNVSALVNIYGSSNIAKKTTLLCRNDELMNTVRSCQESPFSFIAAELEKIKDNLSIFIYQILPFFSTLFADWPIFNWGLLSIYEYSPEDTIGNSMPLEEYSYLCFISTLQELIVLFLMSFPELMDSNQQFTTLGNNALSESSLFYLSRTFSIKTSELIRLAQQSPAGKQSKALPFLRDNLEKTIDVKNSTTHLHIMKQLIYLAEDIENLAGINFGQFTRCIHQIRAITSFAFYEIELFFRIKDQKLWLQDHVAAVAKLFFYTDKITELFIREKHSFERFFVYNLSTADATYLNELLQKFGGSTQKGQVGNDVITGAGTILKAIQSLDLNEFDTSSRYDFTPLILTHGRILHRYNQESNQYRISYMNPLFEHLSTIALHCQAANDATRFFLECCPMHTLWRHYTIFTNLMKSDFMPLNCSVAFLHSFSYFNYDNISLSSSPQVIENLKTLLGSLRGVLSTQIRTIMNKILTNKNMNVMRYSYSHDITDRPLEEDLGKKMLNPDFCLAESQALNPITQATQFISLVPESIIFFGERIEIARFFISSFTNDVVRILIFCIYDNPCAISDASQFVWSLFGQTGADYLLSLFIGMLNESFFSDGSIQTQAKSFVDISLPITPKGVIDEQRFVYKITSEIRAFVEEGHKSKPYVSFTQQFSGSHYSIEYFTKMFRSFGVHAFLYIDRTLLMMILHNICTLIDKFQVLSGSLNSPSNIPPNVLSSSDLSAAAEALLRISVSLQLRSIVRNAISQVLEENLPGITDIISANMDKVQVDDDVKKLLQELIGKGKNFYFVEKFLNGSEKCSASLSVYFTFIAAMILSFKWDKISFNSDQDSFTNNYHLIPLGYELMIFISPLLFTKASPHDMKVANDALFTALSANSLLIKKNESKKSKQESDLDKYDPLLILIDEFPKRVPYMDYSMRDQLFPHTVLSASYPK